MSILSLERIHVQATAADKLDAIRQTGELLVNTGCVAPEYVNGMLARERTMSTYLGNGVAIPHGEYDNRAHVFHTAISVLQLPAGVEWESGETAHLIIGIAATSDEHVGVLARLAEVVEDEDAIGELIQTADPAVILRRLEAEPAHE